MHARNILHAFLTGLIVVVAACHAEPTSGTTADGNDGLIKVSYTLEAPLARTGNRFTVHVTDAAGAAITGAFVQWEFTGPADALATAATSVELGDGDYLSSTVDFPAAGEWQLEIHVEKESPLLHDHALFKLAVP